MMLGNEQQHLAPIPSYEEATSDYGGADEEGGERLNLLNRSGTSQSSSSAPPTRRDGYRPPYVESVRSSSDSSFLSAFNSPRSSAESLQREMVQMEVMEGEIEEQRRRGSGGLRAFSKRFSSSLSAISLPRNPFRGLRCRMPNVPPVPCLSNMNSAALVPVYRLIAVVVALIVVYVLLATDVLSFRSVGQEYLGPFDPESVRSYAEHGIDKDRIKHWLEYISSFDHMAGTEGDFVLAKYIQGQLSSFGQKTERMQYDVYLNYPTPGGRRVWMDEPKWEAQLEEPVLKESPHDKRPSENTLVFHGHSKKGNVKGPVIYANYGSREDFQKLKAQGIEVNGAIALIRNGGRNSDLGIKIKAAEEEGVVGVLAFSDPKTEGWDWPDSAVMRGSVSLTSLLPGDVLSPGWPSLPGASDRLSHHNNKALVNIPSLPLSYKDTRPLLQAIKGKGKKVDDDWVGGVPHVDEYWTGAVGSSPVVNLQNENYENYRQPVWNVLGEIQGTDRLEEKIVIGNHRDAWCFGASDPNSGTAIMLEVARVLGKMMEFGWKPLRTIVFANWDAKEYNLIGSTEFVEEAGPGVKDNVIAYINLDAAVTGTQFTAAGSPSMQYVVKKVLGRVSDPLTHKLYNDTWNSEDMPGLGAGGDYTAFQHYAGISSVDLSFSGKGYPAHSCFDNFAWTKDIGDPGFIYHETLGKIVILLLLELSDHAIIPLDMMAYWHAINKHWKELQSWVKQKVDASAGQGAKLNLDPLKNAVNTALGHIMKFTQMNEGWMGQDVDGLYVELDDWAVSQRRSRSIRMGNFDKHLLDVTKGGGVPGRLWFKHMIMAPQADNAHEVEYFPGVRAAVNQGHWDVAQSEVDKVADLIKRASRKLLDEVSDSSPT
ncbi:hypothetical protein FN846DRAFT_122994 [Sphaerosporella brunnea]|uniref:Uncharacterized protein n=1 Tax=Sphaerosporella brunnea TaxID=1250544 RepID=A0A5J5ERD2_9PEZI|nr:hypothetical protein FN846DRAFT_122994 [Sphaerosporella brunnea]